MKMKNAATNSMGEDAAPRSRKSEALELKARIKQLEGCLDALHEVQGRSISRLEGENEALRFCIAQLTGR